MTLTDSAAAPRNANWSALFEPGLPPGIKLWRIALDAETSEDHLSEDERERAARFRFPIHRKRFIAGRSALRMLLAEELKQPADRICFHYSGFGKPSVEGVKFNLAHSEDSALLAIAPTPVGVDLEWMRPVEFDLLAKTVFSPSELAQWEKIPVDQKPRAFYGLWTRKEAILKGIGCGISEHVKDVSVFFDDAARIEVPPQLDSSPWAIHTVSWEAGCAAAVAFVSHAMA